MQLTHLNALQNRINATMVAKANESIAITIQRNIDKSRHLRNDLIVNSTTRHLAGTCGRNSTVIPDSTPVESGRPD